MPIISKKAVAFYNVEVGNVAKTLTALGVSDEHVKSSDIIIITPQTVGIFYTLVDPASLYVANAYVHPTNVSGHHIGIRVTTTIVSKTLIRNLLLISENGNTNVSITLLSL